MKISNTYLQLLVFELHKKTKLKFPVFLIFPPPCYFEKFKKFVQLDPICNQKPPSKLNIKAFLLLKRWCSQKKNTIYTHIIVKIHRIRSESKIQFSKIHSKMFIFSESTLQSISYLSINYYCYLTLIVTRRQNII